MLDQEATDEYLELAHWRPAREEWLVNATTETDKQIFDLQLKKTEYLEEYERILAKKSRRHSIV